MLNRFFDKKPGTISGIYNYCDRWCERCAFTARCSNYRFMKKLEGLINEELGDDEQGHIPPIQASIQIVEMRSGTPMDSIMEDTDPVEETIENAKQEEANRKMQEHPLYRLTDNYSNEVFDIIKARNKEDFLEGITIDPELATQLGAPSEPDIYKIISEKHPAILHLSILVFVKTARALGNWFDLLEEGDPHGFTKQDMNGTAKLVLVIIDELLEEWMKLRTTQPAFEEKANQLFDDLLKIRDLTEEQFPKARGFKRPGLDNENKNA